MGLHPVEGGQVYLTVAERGVPIDEGEPAFLPEVTTEAFPALPHAAAATANSARELVGEIPPLSPPGSAAPWTSRSRPMTAKIEGKCRTADAVARRAKAANNIRVYRVGVRLVRLRRSARHPGPAPIRTM